MAGTILNSPQAIQMSLFVMRAYARMRRPSYARQNGKLFWTRSGLFAIERQITDPLNVTTADFEAAWREIILNGGLLTREVLGFPMHERTF